MAQPVTSVELRKQVPQGAVDPNVKIPRHVLEAGKRSEEMQKAVLGVAEPSIVDPNAPPVTPPSNPEAPAPEAPQPIAAAPEVPPATPQEPGLEAPVEDGRPVDWEHKFKSYAGRLEAQSKRHAEQLKQVTDRLEQLARENQQLRATVAPPPMAAGGGQPLVSEQEIQEYGPEFVDVMRRVAAETAAPLQSEIERLRAGLGSVQQETGNVFLERMNSTISSAVPNWSQLNEDPKFVAWSALPDIFSGAIRKDLMQEAWNAGDARRVTAFFQAYLAEEAATNPQGGGQQRLAPRTVVSSSPMIPPALAQEASLDLTALAAPGRAHSAGSAPAEKPTYTAAEISRFYTDVAAGRWNGREAQRAAIDADIMLAQREGRIIPDNRTQLPKDPYMR